MTPLTETAYAKINLALHVRRQRDDGYHELETLFAFVDGGDRLEVSSAPADELRVTGEFGGLLPGPSDNIVMKALTALPRPDGWNILLEKNLPVAAGLGGGSADAAALFRVMERQQQLPDNWHELAAQLGADVPSCVRSVTILGLGTGTELVEIEDDLSGTAVLLVNPRVPLATGPVFKGWWGRDQGPLPTGTARDVAFYGRNDLESSAMDLVPQIADVIEILRASNAFVARMSGSGATCFGLYHDASALKAAREEIARKRPNWWQFAGSLR